MHPGRRRILACLACLACLAAALALTGCGEGVVPGTSRVVQVVAAESFWGSIARQLGGAHAAVTSVISNPAQDPHSYEPSTGDARTFATAQLAIVNGIGYDRWASQLLAANPTAGRTTLDVGRLFGLVEGDNPHRWYDPGDVLIVARTIAADLSTLDPRDAAYFTARLHTFQTAALGTYHALIAEIHRRDAGVPVGASESIFALLAPALGLDLRTPAGFMKAISEGTDVSAQDAVTAQQQITRREIRVWIDNAQNATPQVQQLNAAARAAGIPIVTITETLSPAGDTFAQWQTSQLQRLRAALDRATGR